MYLNVGFLAWSTTMQAFPQYPVLDHDITCDCLVIDDYTQRDTQQSTNNK
ncbi:MAG TPA: hypothetical protein VGI33_17730 [Paenibacillus sp.]